MTLVKNKIKNLDEFCKIYKISIPAQEYFDYYISVLQRSAEFKDLPLSPLQDKISDFIELENFIEDNGYTSVGSYKMMCLDNVKDYLINTEAYKEFNSCELPKEKLESRDWINKVGEEEFATLLSIDFTSANYSILKTFDKNNTLKSNWKYLCTSLGVHKALVNSKSFRQLVFGHTNPKRFQTLQHFKINKLLTYLKDSMKMSDESIVFISHDELIVKVKDANSAMYLMEVVDKFSSTELNMPVKYTPFYLSKIKKNVFTKTVYDFCPVPAPFGNFSAPVSYRFSEKYKTLHGVPGNKFFFYFKKYILNELPEERDLIYYNDGELCTWIDESVKSSNSSKLPHYEKLEYSLTMTEAKEYTFLWNGLNKVLPELIEEEKRRIIELVLNSCKYCYQAPTGCFCHRDD